MNCTTSTKVKGVSEYMKSPVTNLKFENTSKINSVIRRLEKILFRVLRAWETKSGVKKSTQHVSSKLRIV